MEHEPVAYLGRGPVMTGSLHVDVPAFLRAHGCAGTADHSAAVAAEASRLARRFGCDPHDAELAGWLHDISAVLRSGDRLAAAQSLGIPVLPEEAAAPMILHQKLSEALARSLFGVREVRILDAVACHTTLRAGSTVLDRVVFVADKIAWDGVGDPPYLAALLAGLNQSLEHAALAYLQYLWSMRQSLPVVHPWMVAARRELRAMLAKGAGPGA